MNLSSISVGMVLGLAIAIPSLAAPSPRVKPASALAAKPALEDAVRVTRDLDALCATLAAAITGAATLTQNGALEATAPDLDKFRKQACEKPDPDKTLSSRLSRVLFEFDSIARDKPASYIALIQLPGVRDRLRAIEATYERPVFASEEAVSRGRAAAQALLPLVSTTRNESSKPERLVADMDDIDLKLAEETLQAYLKYPVPAHLQARAPLIRMEHQINEVYKSDRMMDRLGNGPLNDTVMEFYLSLSPWHAQQHLFILASSVYVDSPAKTLRYLTSYRTRFCQGQNAYRSHCVSILSEELALHAALRDRAAFSRTRKELVRNLKKVPLLDAKMAAARSKEDRELYELFPNFVRMMPSFEFAISDASVTEISADLEKNSAQAYLLVLAEDMNLRPLLKAFLRDEDGQLDDDKVAASTLAFALAYARAQQIDDRRVVLRSAREISNLIHLTVEQMKADGETERNQAITVVADLIRGAAELHYGDIRTAEKIVASIQNRLGKQQPPEDTGPSTNSILSACESAPLEQAAGVSSPSSEEHELEPHHQRMELEQLTIAIADKRGRRVPLAMLDRAIDSEANELLGASQVSNSQQQGSIASLLDIRDKYGKWRSAQAQHVRKVADGVTCFLSRPRIRDLLGLEFVNADAERRNALAGSVHALMSDQERFSSASFATTESDFMLLQAVAILQADKGISASTARQVFKRANERQAIKQLEVSLNMRKEQGASLAAAMSSLQKMEGNFFTLMENDPEGFANYSYLRNQTISTLTSTRQAMKNGEAALLFSQFEKILVATVITRDQASSHVIPVSRPEIRTAIRKLRAGLNPRSSDGSPLPPPYPLETAWELYSKVIKPVSPSLQGAEVVYVIPGEDFAGLPLGALLTSKPPKAQTDDFSVYRRVHWLADRYAFVILPSIHSLTRLEGRFRETSARQASNGLLGIGQPLVSDAVTARFRLEGTPNTTRLLESVRQPGDPQPLLKGNAHSAGIARHTSGNDIQSPQYLLINSHALTADQLIPTGIDEAALLLSPLPDEASNGAEFLTPSKVIHLNTPVKVALLLACDTGSGASTTNVQAYSGLVQAFLFAGAQSVLASVLPVSNTSTEAFATALLKRVRTENIPVSKAASLAAAELRCMDGAQACSKGERGVWAHPAYWSLFTLVGSGR